MAATLHVHRRLKIGPALRIVPLPVASLTLSTGLHLALMVAIVLAVNSLNRNQSQAYVVNLVPAVAAIGSPRGDASAPPHVAPRPEEPAPKAPAAKEAPAAKAGLPDRPRDLPARVVSSRDPMSLPERRSLPPRSTAPALPRPDQKELPTLPTATASTPGSPLPVLAAQAKSLSPMPQTTAAAPPPPPLGQASGSSQGKGAVTVEVDFPYSWYFGAIHRKISERWDDKALPGQQPVVVFEIGRDGQVNMSSIAVEKTSGNPLYDRAALRAIQEANPFPPLPDDFKRSLLRVHLNFLYNRDRG